MNDKLLSWEQAVDWLRQQPEQQIFAKQCYYDDPVETAADRFYQSEEWAAVEALLGSSLRGKVLDLGAGRGISSYAFAKAGCSVLALEPDPSEIVGAQAIQSLIDRTQLPIEVVQEYGEELPFADNSFEIVYGRAVLHHAHQLNQLCREAARVLKPGGILLATREHVISRKEDLPAFLSSHSLHSLYGGENAYLLREYTQALKSAGLTLRKVIGPWESAINYAPTTHSEFRLMLSSVLTRWLSPRAAQSISSNVILQRFYGHFISQKSRVPGRHYSFLAIKP